MTTITFITGANKGLGYETARRLTELGHTVILGARDPERGEAAAGRLGVRFVPIDVTDDASVAQAAADVEAHEGRVDRLINNAGIVGNHAKAEDITGDDAALVFDFNGHRGTQTVTEGTDAIVTLATEPPAAGTGRYIDRFGPVPW
jgi:NAD(P)-dependent dehydrogenase (short-subunit alcohol dehydrogenase family)